MLVPDSHDGPAMVFNSLTFLIFFTVVLALHHLPLSWRLRKTQLLLASYLFYAAWNPPFVLLLWLSTVVDWFAARGMAGTDSTGRRRLFLLASLATNLGMLGFFKYGNFLLENFSALLHSLGLVYQAPALDIVLPMGISFYTFQTLSYTLDVYRGNARPCDSFLDFSLYVTFFPQLVAGPIVRPGEFLPQCREPRRADASQLGWGLTLLLIGLFEKVVLADKHLAPVADSVFSRGMSAGFVDGWVGTFAFSAQIFFDFAGYSTCAIGAALCLGFHIPDNFHYPYGAVGFSDFWKRWHISLSSWLRDYVYIPLGGNRRGRWRTRANLMMTMLLGGLWHGAAWRFVIWGGLHGAYLWVERVLLGWGRRRGLVVGPLAQLGLALLTYACVCLAWVFFRAQDLDTALSVTGSMIGWPWLGQGTGAGSGAAGRAVIAAADAAPGVAQAGLLGSSEITKVLGLTVLLLTVHWRMRHSSLEQWAARRSWWARGLILMVLLLVLIHTRGEGRAFIYFQF